jgi:DNA-binding phage protein
MCNMVDMDFEKLSIELISSIRGRRSQAALSRRLGYRSNVVYAWESGRAWPTAAGFFKALQQLGRPMRLPLQAFYKASKVGDALPELSTPLGIARFLEDLRGRNRVVDLAKTAGRSRFAVARWLSGQSEPRLPDFLRLVECASLRLLDFLACFVDPLTLLSVSENWKLLEKARRAAYEMPWSQAVLRVIELESYRALPRHRPGFIAEWLQMSLSEEENALKILLGTGQIVKKRGKLIPGAPLTLDTRRDEGRARQAKAWWTELGLERMKRGDEGTFSYNLFSVSRNDLEKIQELHRGFFRELRRIVADSEPAECIALVNTHLFELGPKPSE